MTRRVTRMASFLILVMLAVSMWTKGGTATPPKPHIIYILADDLGFNDVSWHNPAVVMPHLHQLATEGLILEQSYVQPVCTPTRAALMTGRYPFTIGRQSGALKPMRPTGLTLDAAILPQVLKQGGYKTHMVGKWHLGFCKWEYTPTFRGFDSFFGFYTGGQGYYSHMKSDKLGSGKVRGYDLRNNTEIYRSPDDEYSPFMYAKRAQEIIDFHNPGDPLFLYLPFQSVHGPLEVPQEYANLYKDVPDPQRRTYLGMVTALDDAVGGVVRTLKQKGLYENTIIIFNSDNGGSEKTYGNNWPLKGHKSTLYEGGIRVASFVHSPLLSAAVPTKRVHKGLIHVVDWLPTLASLAGVPYPADLDGVDQWPHISGTADAPPRTKVVLNLKVKQGKIKASVRDGNYKLIVGEEESTWTYPLEGLQFSVSPNSLQRFRKRTHSIQEYLTYSRHTNHQSNDEQPKPLNQSLAPHVFSLPNFDQEEEDSSDDSSASAVDCTNLTRKQCKKLRRKAGDYDKYKTVQDIRDSGVRIELYNIEDDPTEEINVAQKKPAIVNSLLNFILEEMRRAVPGDNPPREEKGSPRHFGGVFSPGWC